MWFLTVCVFTLLCAHLLSQCMRSVTLLQTITAWSHPAKSRDHVWSLRRVRQPGGDHRQFLGGETAGHSLWHIKPNWELTLLSDELSLNRLRLGGERKDLRPRLSTARRHRFTHKRSSLRIEPDSSVVIDQKWHLITQHNDNHMLVLLSLIELMEPAKSLQQLE